jgi:SPP1 gp7 family putative phage head morphogenesis protein
MLHGLARDRSFKPAEELFRRAKQTESFYIVRLRQVARAIDALIAGFSAENLDENILLQGALGEYANVLEPWARAVGWRMIRETAARDASNWDAIARKMGRALRREIETAPTGLIMRQLLDQQVQLITSLPRDAVDRVRNLMQEGIIQGTRPKDLAARIMETGAVTRSRATLIARTETARTASVLTQARATHIGCTHFTWVTAGDSNVRSSHRRLNGKSFRYDDPPISDPPDHRSLPGQIWNCRCIGIPIIED